MSLQPLERAAYALPIIRHGYSPRPNRDSHARAVARKLVTSTATHCGICGQPLGNEPTEADHILPVSAGGTDHPSNLRAVHRSCNRRRGQG